MPLLKRFNNSARYNNKQPSCLYYKSVSTNVAIGTLVITILILSGCFRSSRTSSSPEGIERGSNSEVQSKIKERVYFFPTRQLPPPPVYGRLITVRPPEPLPANKSLTSTGPELNPIIHLEIEDATIYEITKVLAEAHRYSFYCSSLVGKNKISLNRMGTIDELAKYLEEVALVKVIVDHNLKEVRVLRKKTSGNRSPKLP